MKSFLNEASLLLLKYRFEVLYPTPNQTKNNYIWSVFLRLQKSNGNSLTLAFKSFRNEKVVMSRLQNNLGACILKRLFSALAFQDCDSHGGRGSSPCPCHEGRWSHPSVGNLSSHTGQPACLWWAGRASWELRRHCHQGGRHSSNPPPPLIDSQPHRLAQGSEGWTGHSKIRRRRVRDVGRRSGKFFLRNDSSNLVCHKVILKTKSSSC